MKKIAFIILSSLCIAYLVSCKHDLPVSYAQNDAVYFGTPNVYILSPNSMAYSFARHPSKVADTAYLTVSLLGSPAGKDREFTIANMDTVSANGVQGTDYKLLPPYIMPANAVQAQVPIIVYRSKTLDTAAVNFYLKIVPNQNFTTGITAQSVYNIRVTYLQKPASWDTINTGALAWAKYSNNLGTWTKAKYQLILTALYNPVADTTVTEFPGVYQTGQFPPIYTQYLQIIKNYILKNYPGNYSTPQGVGATLRDPDANNAVIQIGPSNY